MLEFCSTCRNLLEVVVKAGVPCHQCAFCNNTVPIEENALLYEDVKATSTVRMPSKYAALDPTVPVFNNIPCQNKACKSHKEDAQRAVAAIQIDEANLRFAYTCRECLTQWTN